jgi:Ca2+-binding RTX toxin-like protein
VAATATVTVTDPLTVSEVNAIAAVAGVVTATVSDGDLATLVGLTTSSTDAITITVTDTTATAANLNTVNGITSVAVVATAVLTITGAAADVNTAYTAGANSAITGLGNEAVTLTDITLVASTLNTLNDNTTGVVNAATVTTLTGTAANVITAYVADAASEISLDSDVDVTLTGVSTKAQLTTIDGYTSGTITAAGITDTYTNILALATASPSILEDATDTVTVNGNVGANLIDMSDLGSLHDLTINGLAGADTIYGSAADDTIVGGTGADLMYGGLGNDTFEVSNIETNGSDSIWYFTTDADAAGIAEGVDWIEFSDTDLLAATGFTAYGGTSTSVVTLNDETTEVAFVSNATGLADEAYATFVYNTATGVLSFDADGTGTTASSITVATLYNDDGSMVITDFASTDLTFIA